MSVPTSTCLGTGGVTGELSDVIEMQHVFSEDEASSEKTCCRISVRAFMADNLENVLYSPD